MHYQIVRVFPEAYRRGLSAGDSFVPSNRESAQALMQAGLLRAVRDERKPGPTGRETLSLRNTKALTGAPQNKDAANLRKNK